MNKLAFLLTLAAAATCGAATNEVEDIVLKPGTGRGTIVIVNEQKKVAASELKVVADLFAESTECTVRLVGTGEPSASAKGTVTLRIVDKPDAPITLLALEDHWGEVNVAKLVDDLKSDSAKKKFLPVRTRNLTIKMLSLLCGGGASQFPGNITATATLRELDYLESQLPIDVLDHYAVYLPKIGVTPRVTATYEEACLDGWAPAPTNAAQKAIWDKAYEIPTKPIKIKYQKPAGK